MKLLVPETAKVYLSVIKYADEPNEEVVISRGASGRSAPNDGTHPATLQKDAQGVPAGSHKKQMTTVAP